MAELSQSTIIGRGSDHVETRVGEQTMMMSVAQGKYFALEETAQRIWELIEQPRSVAQIVEALVDEYDVPEAQCQAEVEVFLADLLGNGLAVDTGDVAAS